MHPAITSHGRTGTLTLALHGVSSSVYSHCTAQLRHNHNKMWHLVVHNEVTLHNHNVNKGIYDMYKNSAALIGDDLLLGKQVDAMVQVEAPTRNMANFVGHAVGHPVTTQQIRNIMAGRLGGPSAEARMKKLVADFLETEGNSTAFLWDQKDMTNGLIMQSKAQVEIFERWPEVMVLDWTYNTNNLGMNLGSLMSTGPTGRGLPVCEFLSVTETNGVLRTILTQFKQQNPVWKKIEAFVIDKDYVPSICWKGQQEAARVF